MGLKRLNELLGSIYRFEIHFGSQDQAFLFPFISRIIRVIK